MNGEDTEELLRRIEENTRAIADWLQIAYGEQLKVLMRGILTDTKRIKAYEESTGDSSRSVAAAAEVSDRTIREWWREWMEAGLVEETEVPGRFRRKYDLKRLGPLEGGGA